MDTRICQQHGKGKPTLRIPTHPSGYTYYPGYPPGTRDTYPPPTKQTDTCENIAFPQLCRRPVKNVIDTML